MKPLVLLTRPEGSNDSLESKLVEAGWPVAAFPLLHIEPLEDSLRSPVPELVAGDRCIFISANAVSNRPAPTP